MHFVSVKPITTRMVRMRDRRAWTARARKELRRRAKTLVRG